MSYDTILTAHGADDSVLRYGWAALKAQRFEEAERMAREVLSHQPQHVVALHLVGLALVAQRREHDAIAPLGEAARETGDPLREMHYALALRAIGRQDEAIEWLGRAISRRPVFALAFHELGLIFCSLRRYDEAEAVLKEGIALAPAAAELSVELGGVYICRADPGNAKIAFARALALAPGHVRARLRHRVPVRRRV